MQLFYEGTDITEFVDIYDCVHRDVSGGRADGLAMTLGHAGKWFAWGPQKGDKLIAACDGYDTGILYLDMILPENGKYRITATSMPAAALHRAWKSYENTTIRGVLKACAAESGVDWATYGVDENAAIPFLLRKNEGCAALLQRMLQWEGATLKCLNGKYTAIGIAYAQGLTAKQTIEIDSQTPGLTYRKIGQRKLAAVNVVSPYGNGRAEDTEVTAGEEITLANLPVFGDVTAARWARGILLSHNRTAEELKLSTTLNPSMSAMVRVDVTSPTETGGVWMVDEARHDLVNRRTAVTLLRCVASVR
ncbi:MAG: hypothetical protein LLF96_13215 [Eubacteriales bacterium]|nr:hypothetical protein [Eubacteriales bacterium]